MTTEPITEDAKIKAIAKDALAHMRITAGAYVLEENIDSYVRKAVQVMQDPPVISYVVVYGDPVNGFKFRGPFLTQDEAQEHAENSGFGVVAPIDHPTTEWRIP